MRYFEGAAISPPQIRRCHLTDVRAAVSVRPGAARQRGSSRRSCAIRGPWAARADAVSLLHDGEVSEQIGLRVEPVEPAHVAGRIDAGEMHRVHDLSFESVHPLRLWLRPITARISCPLSRRRIASHCRYGLSLGLRPIFMPFTLARARPSPVRVQIKSRSNLASAPSTMSISRPCELVVSACIGERTEPGLALGDLRQRV